MSNRQMWATAEEQQQIQRFQNRMFVGNEVERNGNFNKRTLFVCGVRSVAEIINAAVANNCQHVFFGANYTAPSTFNTQWRDMIAGVCEQYVCSIDCELTAIDSFVKLGLNKLENLTVQLRVTVPHVAELVNSRTYIKIDDVKPRTNTGVYVSLLANYTQLGYTDWDAYSGDSYVE